MKKSNLATKRLWSLFVVCCLMTQIVWAQVGTITGKVIDKAGEGVIGASVLVVGTTMGTITDVDGNFKLDNVRSDGMGFHPLQSCLFCSCGSMCG